MRPQNGPPEPLWKILQPNWPVIAFVFLAWLCGRYHVSILVVPIVIYFAAKYESGWRDKAVRRQLRVALAEEEAKRARQKETLESAAWLNNILRSMWPHLDRWMSAMTTSFLIRTFVGLNQPDANGKKRPYKPDVKFVSFGKTPLTFEGVILAPPEAGYEARIDADFSFRGEAVIELEAEVAFVKVPLVLNDLDITGTLRLDLAFKEKGAPRLLALRFKTVPTINFAIKTLGSLDIMDLPTLKETIQTAIAASIRSSMVGNNALRFDWTSQQPSTAPEDHQEDQLRRSLSNSVRIDIDAPSAARSSAPPSDLPSPSKLSSSTVVVQPLVLDSASQKTPSKASVEVTPLSANAAQKSPEASSSAPAPKPSPSKQAAPSIERQSAPAAAPKNKKDAFSVDREDMNEFLLMAPEEFSGTLRVQVVECRNLQSHDIFGANPYVTLEMNGVQNQTSVVKRTSNPAWQNAVFEFPVPRYLPSKGLHLKIQVFDSTTIGADDTLGSTSIPLRRYLDQPGVKDDHSFSLLEATSGEIRLQCTYIPE